MGGKELALAPLVESNYRAEGHDEIAKEAEDCRVAGHFQVFKSGAIAQQYPDHTQSNTEVPKSSTERDHSAMHQAGIAQVSQKPNAEPKPGLHANSVNDCVC